jgi:cell division protein FtsW
MAQGVAIWFAGQAFINMGVNLGVLPTKGLTLPLMSYGGGSIMIMSATLALLFRVRSDAIAAVTAKPRVRATWANV